MKKLFNITEWTLVQKTEEKRLSKKKRKICRFFDIPIPPRKVFITALIKVDVKGLLMVGDTFIIPYEDDDFSFQVTMPPTEENVYQVVSLSSVWYDPKFTGQTFVIFQAFSAGTGQPQ